MNRVFYNKSFSLISANFTTTNWEVPVRSFIKPPPTKFIKHFNNSRSRVCWFIENLRITWYPILCEEDFTISTEKQPSPLVKPANQEGLGKFQNLLGYFKQEPEGVLRKFLNACYRWNFSKNISSFKGLQLITSQIIRNCRVTNI